MMHPLDSLRRHPDRNHKGTRFEELAEDYLRDVFGATRIWKQVPDLGVDRFFIDRDGRTGAAQMKCLDPDHAVTMRDLTQLVEAAEGADYLVLLDTGGVSKNAQRVIDRHGIAVHLYDDLIKAGKWGARRVARPRRKAMFKHQRKALRACTRPVERGQIIMATGSGKTLVQSRYAEKHDSALIMVPSMQLVRQTVAALRQDMPKRSVLAVYSGTSPDTVGLPVEVATDPAHIAAFLAKAKKPLVVATYQSGDVLAAGAAGFEFGTIVFDEAHRTAGPSDGLWKVALDDSGIAAGNRRFFTATPRVHAADLKAEIIDAGRTVYSMDEAAVYGERLFEMSLKEAIDIGRLTPLDIAAGLITEADVMAQIDRNRWTDALGDEDAVYDVASVLFTLKQARDEGLRRILTFHSRVAKAQRAAGMFRRAAAELGMDVNVLSVDNTSPAYAREEAKRMLADESTINIVCNVNLFTEGVDAPALDAVVFFDPKSSNIAIVQSIGRALRKHPTKDRARLVLPVYVADAKDVDDMLERSRWDRLFLVSSALRDMGVIIEQVEHVEAGTAKRIISGTRPAIALVIVTESMDVGEVTDATEAVLVSGTWDAFMAKAKKMPAADYEAFMEGFATRHLSDPGDLTVDQIADLLMAEIDEVA